MRPERAEKCCVPGCEQRYSNGLLNFPTGNESLIKKWKKALKIQNTSEPWKICRKHFDPNDITEINGQVEVKDGAIPSRKFEFDLICRFCFRHIINERMIVELDPGEVEMFEKFTGVKLKFNINLPNLACNFCIEEIEQANKMKNKFIKNQKTCENFMQIKRLCKAERLAKLGPTAANQEHDSDDDDSSDDDELVQDTKRGKHESTGTAAGTSGTAAGTSGTAQKN